MTKILHVCLSGIYTDGFSYQENLLTKYHVKLGYEVGMLTGEYKYTNKNIIGISQKKDYIDENGVKIFRIPYKNHHRVSKLFRQYTGTYDIISKFNPDIIFIHGCQFLDVKNIIKFLKKNKDTIVYVDNHADFSNSAKNFISKYVLNGIIWKKCAQNLLPYTKMFYGVLPSRCEFLNKMYKIPKSKIELLVMGADDEFMSKPDEELKSALGINKDDFLVTFGGKIDSYKKEVLELMKIVQNERFARKLTLLIFGSVDNDIKKEFDKIVNQASNIKYIGWIDSEKSYDYFAISNLVCFPGRHSVFWEQVTAQGVPLLCKYWEGTTHIDIGGNVIFDNLSDTTILKKCLHSIIDDEKTYLKMLQCAQSSKRKKFLYSQIAKESIN